MLPANKYANTSRSVSGTVTVETTDSILNVDTSSIAATINLQEFVSGYWSTEYVLYVVDASSNAATNNITVAAPSGYTINGSSTLVLSTSGIRCRITISSNNSYLASTSNNTNIQAYQTVQENATSLPQRTILNFLGSGVTVVDALGKTNVFISGGVSQAYQTIQDEGISATQRSTLNFIGSSVSASDDAINSRTNVTIQAYNTVEDEGVAVTQRASINFVGSGVTVTDLGGKTIVTIPGSSNSIISLTNSAMLALISGATVIPGQFYLVTDATYTNGGVLIQGITTTSTSATGIGLFLNADYQAVGNYSSVSGFAGAMGLWSPFAQVVSANNVVVYNNNHYKNLTGSWGTAPSGDSTNWSVLARTSTTGFILECDFVKYNVTTNIVVYRADKRGNEVDLYAPSTNTLTDFSWGNNKVTFNRVQGNSVWGATNSSATIIANVITSGTLTDTTQTVEPGTVSSNIISSGGTISSFNTRGTITKNIISSGATLTISILLDGFNDVTGNVLSQLSTMTFTNLNGSATVFSNTLQSGSALTSTSTVNGPVSKNYLSNGGSLTFAGLNGGTLTGCEISDGLSASLVQITTTLSNYKAYTGYSNWEQTLDFSDTSIYTAASDTLTIPLGYAYVGIFTCSNCTGNPVELIANSPTNHPFTIKPGTTQTLSFTTTVLASAVTNCILLSEAMPSTPTSCVGATNGGEELVIKKFGTYNGITQFNCWK